MHYCLLMLTKTLPTDNDIDEILKPFNSEAFWRLEETNPGIERPKFTWDWWQVGGRYNGKFKLKFEPSMDLNTKYQWGFHARTPRTGRLFRSQLLEALLGKKKLMPYYEEDFFLSMGGRDGYLYVDGAPIADMIDFNPECFCFLDVDGTAYARDTWNGKKWITDESFDDTVKKICADRLDCFATIIDLHD